MLPNIGVSGVRGEEGGDDGPLAMAYNVPDAVWAFNVTPTGLGGRGSGSSATNPLHFGVPYASGGTWCLSPFGVTVVTVYEAPYVAVCCRGVSWSVCELPLIEEVELAPGDAGESGGREPEYVALQKKTN